MNKIKEKIKEGKQFRRFLLKIEKKPKRELRKNSKQFIIKKIKKKK